MHENGTVTKSISTSVAPIVHAPHAPQHSTTSPFAASRKRRALIWGITSTVLSAIGLIGLGLFEQYNGMISELRGDLKHFNETVGEYAKKDKVVALREVVKQCATEITASNLQREQLERELKSNQQQRAELQRELQDVRERLAYVEGLRAGRAHGWARSAGNEIIDSSADDGRAVAGGRGLPVIKPGK